MFGVRNRRVNKGREGLGALSLPGDVSGVCDNDDEIEKSRRDVMLASLEAISSGSDLGSSREEQIATTEQIGSEVPAVLDLAGGSCGVDGEPVDRYSTEELEGTIQCGNMQGGIADSVLEEIITGIVRADIAAIYYPGQSSR